MEEVDGGRGQAAELDLPGDLLDEVVALLVGALAGEAHAGTRSIGRDVPDRMPGRRRRRRARPAPRAPLEGGVGGRAAERQDDRLDPRRSAQLVADGRDRDPGRLVQREAADARCRARAGRSSSTSCSRARANALRIAASMAPALVRRSRSSETAWITHPGGQPPAGVTIASPTETGSLADRGELDLRRRRPP